MGVLDFCSVLWWNFYNEVANVYNLIATLSIVLFIFLPNHRFASLRITFLSLLCAFFWILLRHIFLILLPIFYDNQLVALLDIIAIPTLYAVFADSRFTLSHCVLPLWLQNLKALIRLTHPLTIIVA